VLINKHDQTEMIVSSQLIDESAESVAMLLPSSEGLVNYS